MGIFGKSKQEKVQEEEQRRAASHRAASAEADRIQMEQHTAYLVVEAPISAASSERFKSDYRRWIGQLDTAQRASDANQVTAAVLELAGDKPVLHAGGLGRMSRVGLKAEIRAWAHLTAREQTLHAYGTPSADFWDSVLAYSDQGFLVSEEPPA